MREKLSVISSVEEVEAATLREVVGIGESVAGEALDAALQAELGDDVRFLYTASLYSVMPNGLASKLDRFDGSLLVRYVGMSNELTFPDESERKGHLAPLTREIGAMAYFSVVNEVEVVDDLSQYPDGVTSTLFASEIAVSVDKTPLRLQSLQDGLSELRDMAARVPLADDTSHPALRVVR